MDAKKFLFIVLTFYLFGFASGPYSRTSSLNTSILTVQAEAGDADAQYQLGEVYKAGIGVRHSNSKAKKWFRLSALNGHKKAQNNLGEIYQKEKNYIEAREWYEHAAKQNHPEGITNLAILYDLGLGVMQNKHKAYELYLQSANLGNAQAMYKVGRSISSGQVVTKDEFQGCVWNYVAERHLSAGSFSKNFADLRQRVQAMVSRCENILTENQITSAKKEAVNWKPRILYGSSK